MTAAIRATQQQVPTNAVALAGLMYNDACTSETWIALVKALGYANAFQVWWDAAALLEQWAPRTREVITRAGVDHDPVPGQPVCVCGLVLAAVPRPSDLTPPQGTPCPYCYPNRNAT